MTLYFQEERGKRQVASWISHSGYFLCWDSHSYTPRAGLFRNMHRIQLHLLHDLGFPAVTMYYRCLLCARPCAGYQEK